MPNYLFFSLFLLPPHKIEEAKVPPPPILQPPLGSLSGTLCIKWSPGAMFLVLVKRNALKLHGQNEQLEKKSLHFNFTFQHDAKGIFPKICVQCFRAGIILVNYLMVVIKHNSEGIEKNVKKCMTQFPSGILCESKLRFWALIIFLSRDD